MSQVLQFTTSDGLSGVAAITLMEHPESPSVIIESVPGVAADMSASNHIERIASQVFVRMLPRSNPDKVAWVERTKTCDYNVTMRWNPSSETYEHPVWTKRGNH